MIRNILFVFALTCLGCAKTATVSHLELGLVEGQILDSTAKQIRLTDGRVLDKDAITDIDHPGNIHFTIGSVMAGLGLFQASTSFLFVTRDGFGEQAQVQLTNGLLTAAIGGALFYWGYTTWAESVDRTEIPAESF